MKGTDGDLSSRPLPFILEGVAPVILSDQQRGEHILMMFPGIVSCGIPFPFDEILKVSPSSEITMINDGLDFVFFFSINDVWGRTREVVPILTGFPERC